jgi:hypothetical protein
MLIMKRINLGLVEVWSDLHNAANQHSVYRTRVIVEMSLVIMDRHATKELVILDVVDNYYNTHKIPELFTSSISCASPQSHSERKKEQILMGVIF